MGLLVTVSSTAGVVWFVGSRNNPEPLWRSGREVPEFEVRTFSGTKFSRENLRGKRYGLIFFSPQCRHCKKEFQQLSDLGRIKAPGSPTILALSLGNYPETEAFLRKHAPGIEFALDENHRLKTRFGVRRIPSLFLIDEDAIILACQVGVNSKESLRGALDSFLNEKNYLRRNKKGAKAGFDGEGKSLDLCDACEKP